MNATEKRDIINNVVDRLIEDGRDIHVDINGNNSTSLMSKTDTDNISIKGFVPTDETPGEGIVADFIRGMMTAVDTRFGGDYQAFEDWLYERESEEEL